MQLVLLIGRPGSGKGTQAMLLKKEFTFEVFILGDLLREKATQDNFTGKKLKRDMNMGKLSPTIVISNIWYQKLEEMIEIGLKNPIVFDGLARKLIEAELLLQALDWFNLKGSLKVAYIDISAKESANRIRKRKMCNNCKAIFMGNYQGNKCNKCDGSLIIRSDQSEKTIKKREEEFIRETVPVLEFFKEKGLLEIVNGEQSVEAVFEEIIKCLRI